MGPALARRRPAGGGRAGGRQSVVDHQHGLVDRAGEADVAAHELARRQRPGRVVFGDLLVAVVIEARVGRDPPIAVAVIGVIADARSGRVEDLPQLVVGGVEEAAALMVLRQVAVGVILGREAGRRPALRGRRDRGVLVEPVGRVDVGDVGRRRPSEERVGDRLRDELADPIVGEGVSRFRPRRPAGGRGRAGEVPIVAGKIAARRVAVLGRGPVGVGDVRASSSV